ncbi:MAG: hypothetical protein IJM88_05200 [Bacteroidales bacterium]|nr:hypothetical protein [Bacteroidales bacterium]
MKTDNKNLNLEQLLAEVEHAGRDTRRQEQLSAMIDSLAEAEAGTKRHTIGWWTLRVAAAACVFFFISTAIRVWFIPTNSEPTLVAKGTTRPAVPVLVDTLPDTQPEAAGVAPQYHRASKPHTLPDATASTSAEPLLADAPTIEEAVIEELPDEEPLPIIEEPLPAPTLAEAEVPAVQPEVEAEPAPIAAATTTATERPKKERRRLGSFLRHSQPSNMEGTTLALLQF